MRPRTDLTRIYPTPFWLPAGLGLACTLCACAHTATSSGQKTASVRARPAGAKQEQEQEELAVKTGSAEAAKPRARDAFLALNAAMGQTFRAAGKLEQARPRPLLYAEGNQLTFSHGEQRRSATVELPARFNDLKALAHLVGATYTALYLHTQAPLSDAKREELARYLSLVGQARAALPTRAFEAEDQADQQAILDTSKRYLKHCLDEGSTSESALRQYVATLYAPVQRNLRKATRLQLDAFDKAVREVTSELDAATLKALIFLNRGPKAPRQGSLAVQYAAWRMGELGEGARIVYAEGAHNAAEAQRVLALFLVELAIGKAFYGHPLAFQQDVTAPFAAALLAERHPGRRWQ